MTGDEKPKRSRGRPRRYAPGKRPTLTFRVQEEMHQDIAAAAEASGKSISEEIEYRLTSWAAWQRTKGDIDRLLAEAKAQYDAARAQAIRAAGLQVLREVE